MPDIYISNGGDDKKNNGKKPQNGSAPNAKNASDSSNRKYDDTVYTGNREFEDVYSNSAGGRVQSGKKVPPKKQKKKKHIFARLLAALLALVVLAGASGFIAASSLLNDVSYAKGGQHENKYINSKQLMSSVNVKNILLMGVDSRKEEADTRTDTMMLVSVNTLTREIVLTSFMRDLYVDIPGHKSGRLNSANVYGGPELLMDTIECNYNIDVDNYVLITFDVFKKLIDSVGGVPVDISEAEAKYMHGSYVDQPQIKVGENQLLNGTEALWYCRIRKLDSDFYRTERQREVVSELVKKLTKTSPLKLYSAAKEIMPLIKTDLTKNEIMSLSSTVLALYTGYELTQCRIPADDTWRFASRGGASVIVADEEKNTDVLKKGIYGE